SYLPFLPNDVGDVSIAELLGQTSGIAPESDATHPTLAQSPGSAWEYANTNYVLLGMALHAATGTAYSVQFTRLAGALSLVSTSCGASPYTQNVARGYAWSDGFAAVADTAGRDAACSAFGIASNAADLLHWLENLRSGGVVSAANFTKMTESGTLSDGSPTHYGYGFFIANWFGYDVAEHPGYVPGFSCEDALVLRDGIELVVMSNAEAVDLTPLAKSVVAILEPPLDRNLSAAPGAPVQNENPRVTAALAAIVRTPGFAELGTLLTIEFIERTPSSGLTYDTYRLTFSTGVWRAKVGYRAGGAIFSLSLEPAGDDE
ncbi:MAG TPA: serine hydrolase domain-containing protein, partial [Candidatus Cybelea sp.]